MLRSEEPEAAIALAVDVSGYVGQKRAALACHRSQVTDTGFFAEMSDDVFGRTFGTEWFNVPGVTGTGGPQPVDLLPGLG